MKNLLFALLLLPTGLKSQTDTIHKNDGISDSLIVSIIDSIINADTTYLTKLKAQDTSYLDEKDFTYLSSRSYIGEEIEAYDRLPEKTKHIVDSLKDRGIPCLQSNYLSMESRYMEPGRKVETFYRIEGKKDIWIYTYSIYKNKKVTGFRLIKQYKL